MFTKMGAEMKSQPGNGTCCSRKRGHIYNVISLLDKNEVNNAEYGQLHISEPEMPRTVSRHTARFIVLSHCYTRNKTNTPEYVQLKIFESADATVKQLEDYSNRGHMVEVM
jgi:hypothetical protein